MNHEQKKFKKVIKKRARRTRKMHMLKHERALVSSKLHASLVQYRIDKKKASEHNTEIVVARRKQLIKMLKISDEEAKNYSNGYLEGLYEAAMRRNRK